MKRKFILLPITLTALAPAISLVGCGDPDTPEPRFEPIEIINNIESNKFDIHKDHYYKFYNSSWDSTETWALFVLGPFDGHSEMISVDVVKVEVDGLSVEYDITEWVGCWELDFVVEKNKSYAIYIKANENKFDWFAHFIG